MAYTKHRLHIKINNNVNMKYAEAIYAFGIIIIILFEFTIQFDK